MTSMQIPCELVGAHAHPVQTLALSADGSTALSGDTERTAVLWRDGIEQYRLDLRTKIAKAMSNDRIRSAAFSPDADQFYVASGPTLQAFRTEDGKRLWSYSLPRFLGFLITSPLSVDVDQDGLVAIANDNGTFGIRDAFGRRHRIWRHNAAPRWLKWVGDAGNLVGSDSFSIRQWDASTGEVTMGYLTGERVYGLAASAPSPFFAVRTLHTVQVYRLGEPDAAASIPVGEGLPLLAMDGNRIAIGSEHEVSAYDIDPNTGELAAIASTGPMDSTVLSLAMRGGALLVGGSDGQIRRFAIG